jgi:hypothetical protein
VLTLGEPFKWPNGQRTPNAKGGKTIKTEGGHERHLLRILGATTTLASVTLADLQSYVNTRARERYKKRSKTIQAGRLLVNARVRGQAQP